VRPLALVLVLVLAACHHDAAPPAGPTPVTAADPSPPDPAEPVEAQGGCADPDACVAEAEATVAQRDSAPEAIAANQRALAVFDAACRDDSARGCELVGELLVDHQYYGLDQDDRAAALAYDRACALGNRHACYRYGFYLAEGVIGMIADRGEARPFRWPEDRERGVQLLSVACADGEQEACEHLDQLPP